MQSYNLAANNNHIEIHKFGGREFEVHAYWFHIGKEYKIKGTLNKDEIYFYNSSPIKDTNNLFIDFDKSDLLEFDRRCSNFFT